MEEIPKFKRSGMRSKTFETETLPFEMSFYLLTPLSTSLAWTPGTHCHSQTLDSSLGFFFPFTSCILNVPALNPTLKKKKKKLLIRIFPCAGSEQPEVGAVNSPLVLPGTSCPLAPRLSRSGAGASPGSCRRKRCWQLAIPKEMLKYK